MEKNVYLDHAATTYVKKEVLDEIESRGATLKEVYIMLMDDAGNIQIIKKEGNVKL